MILVEKKYPGEPIEKMLRAFKNKVKASGIIDDVKQREFYEKPSVARRKKKLARKRR